MPTNINLQKIIINSIPTKEIYNQMKAQGLLEPNQLYLVEEDPSVADMTKAVYDANGVVQNAGGIVEYVAANGGKIDVIKINSTPVPIVDKAVDIDIPTELSELSDDATHRVVTDTEKAAWNAKGSYSKPSGGIPKSDLDSGVQGSLSKADSALQSFTETDPVFKASPAYGISSNDIENWDNKQSPISDLGTIRNNAAAGAAKVSCTDEVVASFGYTKNTGDMEEHVYDPDGLVAAAGGIPEYVEQNTPDPESILDQNTRTPTKVWRGTKAQYDALDSYQNDVIYHVIGDEDVSVETVQSFNGRTGDVVPRSGDYTADQVGAIPSSEKGSPNGVPSLDARGKIPLAQIPTEGYVPTTRKINGNALTEDIDITAESIDAVPKTRKINGNALTDDINITTESINAVPKARTINDKPLTEDVRLTSSDVGGTARNYYWTTATYSSGYYKIHITAQDHWMLAFTIRVYMSYQWCDIVVSGYNYAANHWYSPAAQLYAIDNDAHTVYFGYDADFDLWVAIPAKNYAGIAIVDVANGYRNPSLDGLFTFEYQSSLTGTIQATKTLYRESHINEMPSGIHFSTSQPTSSDGQNGDLWIVYEP